MTPAHPLLSLSLCPQLVPHQGRGARALSGLCGERPSHLFVVVVVVVVVVVSSYE